MTLSIISLNTALSIKFCYAECHQYKCYTLFDIMSRVVKLSVVMLSVIMLNVVAPVSQLKLFNGQDPKYICLN
jgi:hypothetical protein